MVLYGMSGLIFALRFLDTRVYFPRVHKAVIVYLGVSALLQLLAVLFGSQRFSLLVAIAAYVSLFMGCHTSLPLNGNGNQALADQCLSFLRKVTTFEPGALREPQPPPSSATSIFDSASCSILMTSM